LHITPSSQPKWLKILPTKLSQRLSGNHNLLAAINNSGWLMFDKLIRLLLGLLVSAWVARYLGPAQYGELAYVLAYLAFFQAVAVLGMDAKDEYDKAYSSKRRKKKKKKK
jgi:PST family polysaccharide transporter